MKRAKKHSAINIFDYPRNNYSAFWEYVVSEAPNGKTKWTLRVMSYDNSRVLESYDGAGESENDARAQAQAKVASVIEKYRLPAPKVAIDAAKADALTREFEATAAAIAAADEPTRARLFSRLDQIRGLLKANGHKLKEPASILTPPASTPVSTPAAPTPKEKKSWLSAMLPR
jgi:hypothetical protein